jgi:iron complex transport system substrate-binding protein
MDYCADQFVLKLADRGDILALSPDATRDFSYMRKEAAGMTTVRPSAEAVIALNPDLVVRSYGGGPDIEALLKQVGVPVHQIGWGDDFDAVRNNVREAAAALGQSERGDALVAEFDNRLAALEPATDVSALYVTQAGATTGPGSMIDLMMSAAGLVNFQSQPGWNPLPLEHLATEHPQMAAAAFFKADASMQDYWSSARHPLAHDLLSELPVAWLDGSTTTCAGWFVMDAIEALASKGREISHAHEVPR